MIEQALDIFRQTGFLGQFRTVDSDRYYGDPTV
jgi:hypothetical protein